MIRFLFLLLPLFVLTTGCFNNDSDDSGNPVPKQDYSGTYHVKGTADDEFEVRTWTFVQTGTGIVITDEGGLSASGTVSGNTVLVPLEDISEEFFSVNITATLVFSEDGSTFIATNLGNLEINGFSVTLTGVKVT
ncbi:MAG: hypothetical protein Q8Q33_01695 [Chlamydiota bacterium]|nr:hypothetical protein [Chlamydiota bacterium]